MAKDKSDKKRVGRPSKKEPEAVTKLIAAFYRGYSITEACYYACISRETYYRWVKEDLTLRDRFEVAQSAVNGVAKEIVVDAIFNKDINAAKWWLEHRNKNEFGPNALDTYEELSETDKMEAKLQEGLNENIATKYRLYLFRRRELLLNDYSKQNEYLVARIDKLIKLADKELADYAQLEVWATGADNAGVRRLLLIRLGGDNYTDLINLADETKEKYDAIMEAEKSQQEPQTS